MKHLALGAALLALPLSALPAAAQEACGGLDRPVVIAGLDFDSARFHNAVATQILDHGYGCTVDELPGTTLPLFAGMIRGDIDITMEIWIPNIQEAWAEAEGSGAVQRLGTGSEATQGWYVPRYLVEGEDAPAPDLRSVADLPRYAELFEDPEEPGKGRFLNCIIGWQCEVVNSKKLAGYGLTETYNNFRPGAAGALDAAIESAILRERPVLFYYWGPTWLLGKIGDQVVKLEEPAYSEEAYALLDATPLEEIEPGFEGAVAFPTVDVSVTASTPFVEAAPELVEFLRQYHVPGEDVSEALAYMQDQGASVEDAARWWMVNHPDVWRAWVPAEVAQKVEAAIGAS